MLTLAVPEKVEAVHSGGDTRERRKRMGKKSEQLLKIGKKLERVKILFTGASEAVKASEAVLETYRKQRRELQEQLKKQYVADGWLEFHYKAEYDGPIVGWDTPTRYATYIFHPAIRKEAQKFIGRDFYYGKSFNSDAYDEFEDFLEAHDGKYIEFD